MWFFIIDQKPFFQFRREMYNDFDRGEEVKQNLQISVSNNERKKGRLFIVDALYAK